MYNTKVLIYGNEIQVNHYQHCIITTDKHNMTKEERREEQRAKANIKADKQSSRTNKTNTVSSAEDNKIRSVRRTKQTIYQYARANEWDYFATFTFADDYRYDYDLCKQKLRKFLNNFKNRVADIEYLAIPERHKDGAWHFHALIVGNLEGVLVRGVHKGRYILSYWKYGINEFEPVRDTNRVSSYITKYITKDLVQDVKDKRRYLASKGLRKPLELEFNIEDTPLADFILGNFPEYDLTYNNQVQFGQNIVNYVQLKKREEGD